MPRGFWGLLSPKLTLMAGPDELRLYVSSGDFAVIETAGVYHHGDIVEPSQISKALVQGYRSLMHRSYGLAPFVRAIIVPGTTPAGLFVWDAVLRTSGASGWLIEDAGIASLAAVGKYTATEQRIEATVFLYKSCSAWQVLRRKGEFIEVVVCGRVPVGLESDLSDTIPRLITANMKESLSRAVKRMVEDEVALIAAAPVNVFIEEQSEASDALAKSSVQVVKTILGGGGETTFVPLPSPAVILGITAGENRG